MRRGKTCFKSPADKFSKKKQPFFFTEQHVDHYLRTFKVLGRLEGAGINFWEGKRERKISKMLQTQNSRFSQWKQELQNSALKNPCL